MPAQEGIGRFAPSTTGSAHPGTLLAALLCWLDARARGDRLVLRLEDLDPQRSTPARVAQMQEELAWFGLDFDAVWRQSERRGAHEAALDALSEAGRLYPCGCSRSQIRAAGTPTPDGGVRYPGTCRGRALPAGGWRACAEPLRLRLPEGVVVPPREGEPALDQDPLAAFGDPIVRRRDGAIAYHLASVVDDHDAGVTRVVRGRDLATSTATQVRVREALGLPVPVHRHHLLLLEPQGDKLAKFHGSVGVPELREEMDAAALRGVLAHACGLAPEPAPVSTDALLADFSWDRVRDADRVLEWDGARLTAR